MGNLGLLDLEDRDLPIATLDTKNFDSVFVDDEVPFTNKALDNYNIKNLKCGGNHTLVLLENGLLLGAGELQELRSGQTVSEGWYVLNYKIRDLISSKSATDGFVIQDISTCWDSSFIGIKNLQSELVEVFSFGKQSKMELGRDENNGNHLVCRSDRGCSSFELYSCLYTSIAVFRYKSKATTLYGWGLNNKQQLFAYTSKSEKQVQRPTLLKTFEKGANIEFKLGKDFLVILNYEENSIKIQGNQKLKASLEARKVSLDKISHFRVMWSSIHFLYEKKTLISLGNGQLGQLSLNDFAIEPVKFLECGSEHIIYTSLVEPLKVFSWGWGEHGNCGKLDEKQDSSQQNICTRPNEILNLQDSKRDCYSTIHSVYGGCASTFIVLAHE